MLTSVSAQQGGSWAPVRAVKPRRADAQTTLKVDVDRLGTIALNAMTQLLELLPLRRLDADKKNAIPEVLLFKCSHNVSTAAPVTPTFPSRDANDKRLRSAERLLAGEQLVRALVRHVAVNHRLRTLEVTHAPLRLFDWQGLFAGIRYVRGDDIWLSMMQGEDIAVLSSIVTGTPSVSGPLPIVHLIDRGLHLARREAI